MNSHLTPAARLSQWMPRLVLAPSLIALLMFVGGVLLACNDERSGPPLWPAPWALGISGVGVIVALYVFMADAIRAVQRGESLEHVLPQSFNWPLFLVAWALMAVPAIDLFRKYFSGRWAASPPRQRA